MDGYAFEKLCKIIFTNLNYGRIEHTPMVGDKGKDLIIDADSGKTFFSQLYNHWKNSLNCSTCASKSNHNNS